MDAFSILSQYTPFAVVYPTSIFYPLLKNPSEEQQQLQ